MKHPDEYKAAYPYLPDRIPIADRPTIPLIGELVDNDEPRLSPEQQEEERRRAREAFKAESRSQNAKRPPSP